MKVQMVLLLVERERERVLLCENSQVNETLMRERN